MKPIEASEILSMGEYEGIRPQFRARIIAEKRPRRVSLGEHMSVLFENRDTVLMQIQEIIRTERITRPSAIQHEIDTYNELLPGESQLSMTLFVEIADQQERERMLVALAGMEEKVALEIAGERFGATEMSRAGQEHSRTTAVHYYKIDLPNEVAARLRAGAAQDMSLTIDHGAYSARTQLSNEAVEQLRGDLSWS